MKATTKRFITILISILLLIFSVLIYSNYISPLFDEVHGIQSEVIEKETQYANLKKLSELYKDLDKKYKSSEQFVTALNESMPLTQAVPDEINQITAFIDIANASTNPANLGNLKLSSIAIREEPLPPERGSSILKGNGILKLTVNLTGSYESFKQYMSLLEKNARLISVNAVNIMGDKKTDPNNLRIDLDFNIYYLLK